MMLQTLSKSPVPTLKSANVLLRTVPEGVTMVLEILLVEDNPAQAYLVRKALENWKTPYNLHVVLSAEEALDFVNRKNGYADAPRPHLTLLDLNLPKEPGFSVLKAFKTEPNLRGIAVIVLSSSTSPLDVQMAVDLHTNAYLPKPIDYDAITRMFEALEIFWRLDARFAMKDHRG
jgi:two-component system, chemotaxis family, response regulator Rcp1